MAAVSALGYDGYMVALEAVKAAGSASPADIAAALPGVTYDGVTARSRSTRSATRRRTWRTSSSPTTETGEFDFVKTQTVADLG